jgi:hypothetical protein
MPELFDPQAGLVETPIEPQVRDVSEDLARAENIIRGLKEPMFIEDLIKMVQETCSLTNDEVVEVVKKIDDELKAEAQ